MSAKYAIVGLGLSGNAALRLLRRFEPQATIKTFDAKAPADYSDPAKLLSDFAPDVLVVSPGVPLNTDWIRDFAARGGKLTGELDLAARRLQGEKCLGVTGSLGKSTTVSLIEAGLQAVDPNAVATGNIGYPLADYVCDVAEGKRSRAQWVVVELSSYQLENLKDLHFEHSAITFFSENHLDRYASIDAYFASKWHLASLTRGRCILNDHGGELRAYFEKMGRPTKFRFAAQTSKQLQEADFAQAKLIGAHNRDNMRVAQALFELCALSRAATDAMLAYAGLPHRLESLGKIGGRIFINDSKATTMESVLTAYSATRGSFAKSKVWLLVGGKDKNLPWAKLSVLGQEPNLQPIFFGKCGQLAREASGLKGECFDHLREAIQRLKELSKPDDVILLSPGGSSLDEFKNFEERGKIFGELAHKIFP